MTHPPTQCRLDLGDVDQQQVVARRVRQQVGDRPGRGQRLERPGALPGSGAGRPAEHLQVRAGQRQVGQRGLGAHAQAQRPPLGLATPGEQPDGRVRRQGEHHRAVGQRPVHGRHRGRAVRHAVRRPGRAGRVVRAVVERARHRGPAEPVQQGAGHLGGEGQLSRSGRVHGVSSG
ncbi:hypothetical protein GCM10025868_04000 [Angustibacter aerolatus]|uniref:Uncharacterized protein n=1 Tax=Angustibacter aerolatus TaxID=1162965 RepID=A0ABQ6JE99_9ACTN|nr:hypothetical protein GCM10025868_04000 [Angustibacter aerolatus]